SSSVLIRVAVPVPNLDLLTYEVPEGMAVPKVGARVVVPLGTRVVTGISVEIDVAESATPDPRIPIKVRVPTPEPRLSRHSRVPNPEPRLPIESRLPTPDSRLPIEYRIPNPDSRTALDAPHPKPDARNPTIQPSRN